MPAVETVSRLGNFSVPKNFVPKLIVDLGIRTKFSTLEYATQFPKAQILSFSSPNSNFLLDHNDLAYHDNIRLSYLPMEQFIDLDNLIYSIIPFERQIDFIKMDLVGREKNILKNGGRWAKNTRYIKARITNYDYQEAKDDLAALGFYSAAMHDGYSFYVVGEMME